MDFFENVKNVSDIYNQDIKIPETIPNELPKFRKDSMIKQVVLKEEYNMAGMYTFVSWRWIEPFAKWIGERKVLEVMAGRGWLTHALRQKGVDVIATDDFSWSHKQWTETLTQVDEMDAIHSIVSYGKQVDIVIMGWPYMDNTAYQVLKKLNKINPHAVLVFIGEAGGCTADEEFWDNFEQIADDQFTSVDLMYESWSFIYDRMYLGRFIEK